MFEVTAEFPMLELILQSDSTPMHIGSSSGWLMFAGIIIRPRATSSRTSSGEIFSRRATDSLSSGNAPRGGYVLHLFGDGPAAGIVHLREISVAVLCFTFGDPFRARL